MNRYAFPTALFLTIFIGLSSGAAWAAAERRIALVIGNGTYKTSPLRNAVHDAEDMARSLTEVGFTVLKAIDADRTAMRRAIRDFGDRIKGGGVGLFYFAGHGIQVRGENFLVPIGAEVRREDEVEDECLKASSVLRKMETAGNRLNIIILDACRDNPFARSFRSGYQGLAKMDAPTGSLLAYATAPGSVASDGPGRNGLYTAKLLQLMKVPGLEILDLFRRVRVDVLAETDKIQVPWESTSLTGEFYFVPPEPGAKTAALPPHTAPIPKSGIHETKLPGVWKLIYKENGRDLYTQWIIETGGTGFAEGEEADDHWWADRIEWSLSGDVLTIRYSNSERAYRVLSISDKEMDLKGVSKENKDDMSTMTRIAASRAGLPRIEVTENQLLGSWLETWESDGRAGTNTFLFRSGGTGREAGRHGDQTWSDDFTWRLEDGIIHLDVDGDARVYLVRKLTTDTMDLMGVGGSVEGDGFRLKKQK